jgi:hypothetical protein
MLTILVAFVASMFSTLQAETVPLITAGDDWCGTNKVYEQKRAARFGSTLAPEDCPLLGACDDPAYRDSWIADPGDEIMYVRMIVHLFAQDDGSQLYSTPEHVAGQVAELNANFAPMGIQFLYQINQVNSTEWRLLDESEIDDMKFATAIEPDRYMNVWVTVVDFSYSFATFPWSYDALESTGGIVMGHFHWNELPNRVFAHEVGHTLGLWHTFHGVDPDETATCGDCYETPGSNSSLLGDLCADTPPTPKNQGPCVDFPGDDPCSGLPWGYTMPENYMSYASQICRDTFTPQQCGRMRCWTEHILDGWVIPFHVEASATLGPAPLDVDFSATTHKTVNSWSWDLGDGETASGANVPHTYQAGYQTVTVDLETPTGNYIQEYTGLVSAYADTIRIMDGVFDEDNKARVNIYVRNYLPLKEIALPFTWDGPIDIKYDSVSLAGHRSDHMSVNLLSIVPSWNSATVHINAGMGPYLDPGSGPIATLFFTLQDVAIEGDAPIAVTSYASFELNFKTYAGDYLPDQYDGVIRISCCRGVVGDANGDGNPEPTIGDISLLIDHLFILGSPLDCLLEADANQSGGVDPSPADITIGDISYLIGYLFVSGGILPPCP